jgi:hypothetical protein
MHTVLKPKFFCVPLFGCRSKGKERKVAVSVGGPHRGTSDVFFARTTVCTVHRKNFPETTTHQLGQTALDGNRASFFTAASAAADAAISFQLDQSIDRKGNELCTRDFVNGCGAFRSVAILVCRVQGKHVSQFWQQQ